MKKNYTFEYNLFPNNSPEIFNNACTEIENAYSGIVKQQLLIDVDGSTIQTYYIGNKKVIVYDDYEVGAVYICSDLNLDNIIEENCYGC